MKQYSVSGFDKLYRDCKSYNELGDLKRGEMYDKCNWIISKIYLHNLYMDEPDNYLVNISRKVLKKHLGSRDYLNVLDMLIELDIVHKNPKYSKQHFSKSYSLTSKALSMGIIEVEITDKKFSSRILKIKEEEYQNVFTNPVLRKILENTAKLMVVESDEYYKGKILVIGDDEMDNDVDPEEKLINENKQKYERYKAFYNEFKILNKITSPREVYNSNICYKPSIAKSGRVYHTVASIPRHIRHSMRANEDELIWEVDMSSAQPSILMLEWLKYIKNKNSISESEKKEYQICYELVVKGRIYDYIKRNTTQLSNLEYSKMKQAILIVINDRLKSTPLYKELKVLFPNFMNWVNSNKPTKGDNIVSAIGQSTEAKIFVDTYAKLPDNSFFLIIHDCIICTEQDTKLVKDKLKERTKELYASVISPNEDLDELFKVSKVSIADEELLKNKNPRLLRDYLISEGKWSSKDEEIYKQENRDSTVI